MDYDKVTARLNGHPWCQGETLLAEDLGDGSYKICSVPLASPFGLGDVVRAVRAPRGYEQVMEVLFQARRVSILVGFEGIESDAEEVAEARLGLACSELKRKAEEAGLVAANYSGENVGIAFPESSYLVGRGIDEDGIEEELERLLENVELAAFWCVTHAPGFSQAVVINTEFENEVEEVPLNFDLALDEKLEAAILRADLYPGCEPEDILLFLEHGYPLDPRIRRCFERGTDRDYDIAVAFAGRMVAVVRGLPLMPLDGPLFEDYHNA